MEVLSFKYMIYYSSNVSPYSRNAVRLQVAKKVFLLDSQSQVQKFLSWIFTFSHFHFFSKYIATFIYHAFYCIAIAQVRIIQEDRRERDEKKGINTSAGDSSSPKASESTAVRERRARWDEGRGVEAGVFSLLLVNILAAYDLVNDPVENVKNEEDQRKGHTRHCVDPFGAADEELAHLLDGLLRGVGGGGCVVVVALDGHAVFGLETRRTHAIGGEAESAVSRLVLLQYSTGVERSRNPLFTRSTLKGTYYAPPLFFNKM